MFDRIHFSLCTKVLYSILAPPRDRYWASTKIRRISRTPTTKPARTLAAVNSGRRRRRGISRRRRVASGGIYGGDWVVEREKCGHVPCGYENAELGHLDLEYLDAPTPPTCSALSVAQLLLCYLSIVRPCCPCRSSWLLLFL